MRVDRPLMTRHHQLQEYNLPLQVSHSSIKYKLTFVFSQDKTLRDMQIVRVDLERHDDIP